ncbi:LacI family transcriptional regulator [Sphaerisporangium rufum]|uniref:LacI family transcriptional regulator n=1 Tax=Sphaerisporangium rufum TaxID=1381558 RepID=A0A919R1H6_9ACTN|nr:LacI family DNA-binding transcriptional regulator [Sphaerisporangium rufum]GII77613.1 LacI family transcriptional regulator [Sphaerisporangium rufum]
MAERAGVSLTTASHCFSGRRPVAAATQELVWRAAAEIGYRHDRARANIGILIRPPEAVPGFAFGTATFADLAGAVAVAGLARGYTAVTAAHFDDLVGQTPRLDGCVVLYPRHGDGDLQSLVHRSMPAVSFDPDPAENEFRWWVGVNYVDSIRGLLTHLRSRGARRVAALVGQTDNMYRRSILGVYTATVRSWGDAPMIRMADDGIGEAAGAEAAANLLRAGDPPDAVITSSSVFARGALTAALEMGVKVPDELMIATVTDGPLAEYASTPITGLRLNVNRSARYLVELLEARIRGAAAPAMNPSVALELIQRSATRRKPQIDGRDAAGLPR